jgi:hypothetical protein
LPPLLLQGAEELWTVTRPSRVHTRPEAKPKTAPVSASTPSIAGNSTPRPPPLPICPDRDHAAWSW